MNRSSIKSSNIKSVGYDPGTKTLEVEFSGGGIYQYSGVSDKQYSEMLEAESVGRFFTANIRNNHKAVKVGANK